MQRKIPAVLLLSILVATSLACGTATQLLYGTPTPTMSATSTLTPTRTVTPSSTPKPDYSAAILRLADLPRGFESMGDEFASDFKNYRSVGKYAYGNSRTGQIIVGTTMILPSSAERFTLKLIISDPDLIMEEMLGDADPKEFSLTESFTLEDVGEVSGGIRGKMKLKTVRLTAECVMFQRGELGALISTFYMSGNHPGSKIEELARIVDGHFLELLPPTSQP